MLLNNSGVLQDNIHDYKSMTTLDLPVIHDGYLLVNNMYV
jgi:hypothetical protein